VSAHAESHSSGEHKHHGLSLGGYVGIWVLLLFFTGLTYWTAHIDLGEWNLPVALLIATTKSTIVCLFFMHLWGDTRVNQFIVVLSVLFVLLMIGMTLADVNTRFPLAAPPNSERFKVPPAGQVE
jgi:cytochrome c oxidase subunit 4